MEKYVDMSVYAVNIKDDTKNFIWGHRQLTTKEALLVVDALKSLTQNESGMLLRKFLYIVLE